MPPANKNKRQPLFHQEEKLFGPPHTRTLAYSLAHPPPNPREPLRHERCGAPERSQQMKMRCNKTPDTSHNTQLSTRSTIIIVFALHLHGTRAKNFGLIRTRQIFALTESRKRGSYQVKRIARRVIRETPETRQEKQQTATAVVAAVAVAAAIVTAVTATATAATASATAARASAAAAVASAATAPMSSSNRKQGTSGGASCPSYTAPGLGAFTSADAHNGCRTLFNGTAGWAYVGPAGPLDPRSLPPGTISYSYDHAKGKDKRPSSSSTSAAGAAPPFPHFSPSTKTSPPRPGEGLGRKTGGLVRSICLDSEDLRHLVLGERGEGGPAGPFSLADDEGCCGDAGNVDGQAAEAGGRGAPGGRGGVASRRGRPIVLTLQAILAATSPMVSHSAGASAATAAGPASTAEGEEEEVGRRNGNKRKTGGGCTDISKRDHFPPLMLRGASTEKGPGLFLAPPILMVRSAAAAAGAGDGGQASGNGNGTVSSVAEAVAATCVAEAAADLLRDYGSGESGGVSGTGGGGNRVGGGGGIGGLSRIGWWLRWATSTNGSAAEERQGDHDGGVGGETDAVPLETTNSADGWQIVPSPVDAVAAAAAADVVAAPAAGGVAEDEEECGSWCDFSAEEEQEALTSAAAAAAVAGESAPLTVREAEALYGQAMDGKGVEAGGSAAATAADAAAVSIETSSKRAARATIYDDGCRFYEGDNDINDSEDNDDGDDDGHDDESTTAGGDENNNPNVTNKASILLEGHRSNNGVPRNFPRNVSPNVLPRSYRDALVAPSATGAVNFSDPKALATARRSLLERQRSRRTSSCPTLVVDGGADGGVVYLWRKAAAGEGGRAAEERAEEMEEDEDPYYARKRVGAFAFRTKPRGKEHK